MSALKEGIADIILTAVYFGIVRLIIGILRYLGVPIDETIAILISISASTWMHERVTIKSLDYSGRLRR